MNKVGGSPEAYADAEDSENESSKNNGYQSSNLLEFNIKTGSVPEDE